IAYSDRENIIRLLALTQHPFIDLEHRFADRPPAIFVADQTATAPAHFTEGSDGGCEGGLQALGERLDADFDPPAAGMLAQFLPWGRLGSDDRESVGEGLGDD